MTALSVVCNRKREERSREAPDVSGRDIPGSYERHQRLARHPGAATPRCIRAPGGQRDNQPGWSRVYGTDGRNRAASFHVDRYCCDGSCGSISALPFLNGKAEHLLQATLVAMLQLSDSGFVLRLQKRFVSVVLCLTITDS